MLVILVALLAHRRTGRRSLVVRTGGRRGGPAAESGSARGMVVDTVTPSRLTAQDEVTDLLVELIRINTSNPTHPERPAAEWVAAKLDEVGIESQIIEAEPGRASTIARIEGADSSRPPLLIHGHLDVVPADAARVVGRPVRRRGARTATSGAAARST